MGKWVTSTTQPTQHQRAGPRWLDVILCCDISLAASRYTSAIAMPSEAGRGFEMVMRGIGTNADSVDRRLKAKT